MLESKASQLDLFGDNSKVPTTHFARKDSPEMSKAESELWGYGTNLYGNSKFPEATPNVQ